MDSLSYLKNAIEVATNLDKPIEDTLELLLSSIENAILIGFAEKMNDESFCVSSVVGDKSGQLKNLEFSIGEGYLGHVAATAKLGYWSRMYRDPRMEFFDQYGIHPKSVFCYPVIQQKEVIGVLFGALSTEANKNILKFLELTSIMLGRQMQVHSLEENLQIRTVRLAALMELSQAMRTVEEVKNILYIILDMSLNLVQGPFSCIAFQPSNQDSVVELITRGITRQKAAEYGRKLATSYIGRASAAFENQSIPVIRNFDTTSIIECPLFLQQKVIAVLAVAVNDANTLEEFSQLLYALSVIGGAALQSIYTDKSADWIKKISLIHKASEFWAKEACHHASEIKEFMMDFATYQTWSETEKRDICQAALLTPYRFQFVQEALPEIPEQVLQIFREYRTAVESAIVDFRCLSEMSQILLLATNYLGVIDIPIDSIRLELRENFEQYLLHSRIESQQILLTEPQKTGQMEVQPLPTFPITEQLTVREQEILQLLVTGKGNREIAQTLYISEHTVKNHMTNIFQKLHVTDRTQAIALVLGQLQ